MSGKLFLNSRQDGNGYIFHIMKTNAYIQPTEEKKCYRNDNTYFTGVGKHSQVAFGTFTGLVLFFFSFFFLLEHIGKIEITARWLRKKTGWQTEFLSTKAEGTYKTCSIIQLSSELQMVVGRAVFQEP